MKSTKILRAIKAFVRVQWLTRRIRHTQVPTGKVLTPEVPRWRGAKVSGRNVFDCGPNPHSAEVVNWPDYVLGADAWCYTARTTDVPQPLRHPQLVEPPASPRVSSPSITIIHGEHYSMTTLRTAAQMTRDDIERMAREAKGHPYTNRYTPGETAFAFSIDRLENFAALVAAAERERFADECIDIVARWGGSVEIEAAIRARSNT